MDCWRAFQLDLFGQVAQHAWCLKLTSVPVSAELCAAIEDGKAVSKAVAKERAKFMCEKSEWDVNHSARVKSHFL